MDEKTKEAEQYAQKRIRAILNTVLPGYRSIYEGVVLKGKEDNLLLIIEELLPKQRHYTKGEILKEFYGDETPPVCINDGLKTITQAVAEGGIAVIDVKTSKNPVWQSSKVQPIGG